MASTIKVDNVQNTPGTNIINKCGATITVGAACNSVAVTGNIVKSNALQASDGGNIVNQCGTDITLGASGDTINLASGASQTGFGRTGTVDWDTSIHTGTVTAATGKGYFVNTTSGGITVNLPAAAVGSIVAVSDYASTAASNNITISPNGSEKINGVNDSYVISTAGLAVTLVYADATKGWKSVTGSDADATGIVPAYVAATGGTPCAGTTCGDYKIHTFTGPGTLCVSAVGNAAGSETVDYMVVAGGGSGGNGSSLGGYAAGAAGAGGYRESSGAASGSYTVSPLGSGVSALPVAVVGYPVTVGGGGAVSPGNNCGGANGSNSVFAGTTTITSTGGGYGGGVYTIPDKDGGPGGSGGGGGSYGPGSDGGTGNTPPVSPPQGNTGADGPSTPPGTPRGSDGGGGGGATAVGTNPCVSGTAPGGAGATSSINGTPTGRAGGGGGGSESGPSGGSATDGGGAGGKSSNGTAGTVNTGGGGGGGGGGSGIRGGAGGSGLVIIRYKFQ